MRTTLIVTLIALLGLSEIQSINIKSLIAKRAAGPSSYADFDDDDWEFTSFISKYSRNYKNKDEWTQRRQNFKNNLNKIREINEANDGNFTLGVTKFTDLSDPEFKYMMGLIPQDSDWSDNSTLPDNSSVNAEVQNPSSVDWRTSGSVGPIRN
jgi:hypothetical protein